MKPDANSEKLSAVVTHLATLDPAACRRLRRALSRIGWHCACTEETPGLLSRVRRLYGEHGIELAGVILRARRGEPAAVIARETAHRWMTHHVWERESRASRAAFAAWPPPRSRAA